MTTRATAAGLELTATATLGPSALVIDIAVHNSGALDIYLLDRIALGSPPRLDPDFAYVELDQAARRVVVLRGIPPQPAHGSPTSLVAPYVTPLRAGATVHETVRLALPITTARAYGNPPPSAETATYASVQLAIAYYARDPNVVERTEMVGGEKVVIPAGFKTMPEIRTLLTSDLPLQVPVREPAPDAGGPGIAPRP